jgi:hypothetical protein
MCGDVRRGWFEYHGTTCSVVLPKAKKEVVEQETVRDIGIDISIDDRWGCR